LEAAVPIPGFQHVFRALFANNPRLINVDARLELMEKMHIDHHVLIPLPWIETIPTPFIDKQVSYDAAQAINDQMADLVSTYPDKFSAVALLPLFDREDMINELETRVNDGFVGGLYVGGYNTKAADHPDFFDPVDDPFPPPFVDTGVHHGEDTLYGKAVELDVPLWLHPATPPVFGDYAGEDQTTGGPGSLYNIYQAITWLLDSSVAMVRMVFAGVFKRYPGLKVVIHHHGALIPSYAERLVYGWEFFEQNNGVPTSEVIDKPFIDHFKNFYCDTATQGFSPDLLKRAVDFFGVDRVLFGTDAPMDATGGEIFAQTARDSVEDLDLSMPDMRKIFSENIKGLINLT
jgi:predicted TIM-barrel fold metal-dependent hydrolase